MSASSEMPRYVSHKKVWALEIEGLGPLCGSGDISMAFKDPGFENIVFGADDDIFARYKPVAGDFYVVYADGYKSFSPRNAFIEGYTREA